VKVLAAPVVAIMLIVGVVGGALAGGARSTTAGASLAGPGGTSRLAWATAFAAAIGAANEAAVRFVVAWATLEGASADQNNPLNSTLPEPGAVVLAGSSAGVFRYPSMEVGLHADVATIEGNPAYQAIIAALDQGDLAAAAAALAASPWCVGPGGGPCPGYGATILSLAESYRDPAALAAAGAVPAGITAVAGGGASGAAGQIVNAAQSQLGVPYVWGGESAGRAFDCSGLAQWVLGQVGIALPRVAQAQFDAGPPVADPSQLQPGDLVFFGSGPSGVEHVGIYIGAGQMIDAPHTGAVVRTDPIVGFSPGYVGATRPAGVST
jgi:cell wall-associated NlpC family hydrolase